MLRLTDVHTYYGDSHILHGVSLRLEAGEAVGLLGRNGAGKTTLFNVIAGEVAPTAGRIVLHGHDVTRLRRH